MATSTAVEPSSEKKTRSSPAGSTPTSSAASRAAGSCVKPAKITCSSVRACSAMASAMAGCACPCRFTHQRGDRVQQPFAVRVDEVRALAADDGRGAGKQPVLRVRMPDEPLVQRLPVGHFGSA